jgi:phosphopantothenoylcysteine decarboxylase / phosphopantothenate---cysteine ligase
MRVLLGITGCIGAYKAAEVLRGLQRAGVAVRVVMTRHAAEFIRPLTFEALSGAPVVVGMYDRPDYATIEHISLAREADLLLVAPATANIISKFAQGLADDFLSTLYLSNTNPVLIAPAMNVEMWNHPATLGNIEVLRRRGVEIIEPGVGYQACGEVGAGRLAEPEEIVRQTLGRLRLQQGRQRDLSERHILITAGPTIEDLDPARYITNRSSGRMGYALAEAAVGRGARVTLVSGPVRIPPPAGVRIHLVRSSRDMFEGVLASLEAQTIFIGAAAVADFRPVMREEQKIKKAGRRRLTIEFEATEDIIGTVAAAPGREGRLVVGFAAESQSVIEYAVTKIREKSLDMIVANDITAPGAGFDVETNAATIIDRYGRQVELPLQSKREMADRILDEIVRFGAELRKQT